MVRTYTGILRGVYSAPRKMIVSLGRRIDFVDGVASGIPENVATHLLNQKVLTEIIPEFETQVVEEPTPVVVEEPTPVVVEEPTPVVVEDVIEEAVEEVIEETAESTEDENPAQEEPSIEFDPVEGNQETSDGLLSRSDIEELYDRLGTWTAVAEELDISTTTLRKYRDELGL